MLNINSLGNPRPCIQQQLHNHVMAFLCCQVQWSLSGFIHCDNLSDVMHLKQSGHYIHSAMPGERRKVEKSG